MRRQVQAMNLQILPKLLLVILPSLLSWPFQATARSTPQHAKAAVDAGERRVLEGQYIVALKEAQATATSARSSQRHASQVERSQDILRTIKGKNFSNVKVFSHAFSGFSFRVAPGSEASEVLKGLRLSPDVLSITPVRTVRIPAYQAVASGSAAVASLHGPGPYTGLDNARRSGFTGAGVKVGIVDSGVDYTHKALGGCFGPLSKGKKCRVIAGYDFIGDDYDRTYTAKPDKNPMDCEGHGTHVAGIVGGVWDRSPVGKWSGVAPGVLFGAYRVLSCQGYGTDLTVLQGVEQAVKDGMDIINLSLGNEVTSGGFSQHPFSLMMQKLTAKGIIIVVAGGNSGPNGLFLGGVPGMATGPISVASVGNWLGFGISFSLNIAPSRTIYTEFVVPPGKVDPAKLAGTRFIALDVLDCDDSSWPDLRAAVVLLNPYYCGVALLRALLRSRPLLSLFFFDSPDPGDTILGYTLPHGFISFSDGTFISSKLKGNGVTRVRSAVAQAPPKYSALPNPGAVSSFSSYGPEATFRFKPDIAAPGEGVLSTLPISQGSWAVLSGTSMAAPFIAGSAALWRQARLDSKGDVSPAALLRDLSSTAVPAPVSASKPQELDSPVHEGAGLVQIDRAIANRVVLEPFRFAITRLIQRSTTLTFQVTNRNCFAVQYRLEHRASLALQAVRLVLGSPNSTFKNVLAVTFANAANKRISTITVAAEKTASVKVTFTMPSSLLRHRWLLGGYLALTPVPIGKTALPACVTPLSLPYFTFSSPFTDIPVFDESSEAPLQLCNDSPENVALYGSGECFGTTPKLSIRDWCPEPASWRDIWVLAYLQMPSPRARLLLYSATHDDDSDPKYTLLGTVSDNTFLPRFISYEENEHYPLKETLFTTNSAPDWEGLYRAVGTGEVKAAVAGQVYALGLEVQKPMPFDAPAGTKPVLILAMTCRFVAPPQ